MAVVRTVAGDIAPDDLGITLCHEHLLIDLKRVFVEPDEPDAKVMAHRAVELETLGWIRSNYVSNLDNLGLYVENEVIEEIKLYQKVGGATLVEVTPVDIGRNPEGLLRIAEAAGLNVVMGSGYYVHGTHPDDMDVRSEDALVDEMTRDVTDGVGNTGIKSGIIGEIGCTWPLDKNERKVLRAAARAQQATGAALTIHPGRDPAAPIEILEVIDGAGGDVKRTIMGHLDRTVQIYEILKGILEEIGGSLNDIVKLTTFYVNPDEFSTMAEVRKSYFSSGHLAASSAFCVQALAHPDALVEVEATAILNH